MKWKFLTIFLILGGVKSEEWYDEHLKIERINEDEMKTVFRFEVGREIEEKDQDDYVLFPRSIHEIIKEFEIQKMIMNMGFGRWSVERWGIPPQPFSSAGAHVFTELAAKNEEIAEKNFKLLLESINGLLCTSISQKANFAKPKLPIFINSDRGNGTFSKITVSSTETTCTENLTKLRKLLACKENGLSTLLHPSKLYDALFHSSQLNIENHCEEKKCNSKMTLEISVVFKLDAKMKNAQIYLVDIFGRKLPSKCTAARKSEIEIGNGRIFDLKTEEYPMNLEISDGKIEKSKENDLLRTWSSQGGFDQHRGVLSVSMKNGKLPTKVTISQLMPHFVRTRYSEIRVECSEIGKIAKKSIEMEKKRKGGVLLQYEIEMAEENLCTLTIPFEKELLRLADYPPDANHGLHIPAALIMVDQKYTVQSTAILINLPVPDFSMPFNVICFVATVFAMIFGPIQLYSTMWLAPQVDKPTNWRKVTKGFLLMMIIFCLYAHMVDLNLNDVRRGIETYLQKLNDLR